MSDNFLNDSDKKIIIEFIGNTSLPSAYMSAYNLNDGKTYSYSYKSSEDGNDIFRIASMTKLFTSIAALQLVESKMINLDDSLNTIIPEMSDIPILGIDKRYVSEKIITLRNLLNHTSGFGHPFLSNKLYNFEKKYSFQNMSDDTEKYKRKMNYPRLFEPGSRFMYGTSTDWVGRLVEKISNMNLNDYFKTKILDPLNLNSTWFNIPRTLENRISPYYQKRNKIFYELPNKIPERISTYSGGGALKSSANDFLKLLKCLLNSGKLDGSRILKSTTVDLMFRNSLPEGISLQFDKIETENSNKDGGIWKENDLWGLAFALENNPKEKIRPQGTGYWGGIWNSYYSIDHKNKIAIVYFSQFKPFNDKGAYGLYKLFETIIYKKYIN